MLSVSVTLRVRSGREQVFLEAMTRNQRGARENEPGCHRFDLSRDVTDPEVFHVYEVYADDAAFRAHQESEHFLAWREVAHEVLAPGGRETRLGELVGGDHPAADDVPDGPGRVFAARDAEYLDRGNGVRSLPLAGLNSGSEEILSGMTEIPPGGEIPLHHHNTDEFIYVISGRAVVTIDGAERPVEGGDSTLVFAGIRHRYVNIGEGPLRILWVYGDVRATRTIAATGVTLGHLERYAPT